jgi:hypothetical protein
VSASEPPSGYPAVVALTLRIAAVAVGIVALAGCGRSGDQQTVRGVVQDFYAAVQDHHGDRACALLSPDARKTLEDQESKPCAEAVEELSLSDGPVGAVRVFSMQAAVEFQGCDTVFLGDTAAGWRISAAGCRPQAHGEPADCELEA